MDYSIAVGIEKYEKDNIPETLYSENDAKEFDNIMSNQFAIKNHILLTGHEATMNNIKNKIETMDVEKGDRVFFFFAGHGQNLYDEPRLCCYDSDNNAMASIKTWLNIKVVMGYFAKKTVNLICFLDACESTIDYSARKINKDSVLDKISAGDSYIYVFSAANFNEKSNADKKLKHGIWSSMLFDALKGNPDALTNNRLTNNSLQNFLKKRVNEYYINDGSCPEQEPYAWGKTSGEFVIKEFWGSKIKTNGLRVEDIYFGTVDADNEIKENPTKFIENYFDLNNVSKELWEKDNYQFVVGRKGTGKTYIGKYMEQMHKQNIKYLSMDSFDYKSFTFLGNNGEGYEPYVVPWKYFILARLLDYINDNIHEIEIEETLRDLYGRKVSIQQILHKKFKRGVTFRKDNIEHKWMEDLAKDNENFEMTELIQIFFILLGDYFKNKYMLILDGLDEKINENDHYRDVMNALIWAIKDINAQFYDDDIDIKVVAFFRKDVFEFVQGANTAKISSGSTINLEWVTDSDDKKKYPLYQFMNIRYQNCLQDHQIDKNQHDILELLPTTMKFGTEDVDTWDWLLNFTTYKPRDVVKMLDECRKKCKKNEAKITDKIIWEAQPEYSRYLLQELKNEVYGFIEQDMIEAIFTQLRQMGKVWREYSYVKKIINKCALELNKKYMDNDVKKIVNYLYEAGVLGVLSLNEHEHWYYRRRMDIDDFIETSKFKLHQGLWKTYSIW